HRKVSPYRDVISFHIVLSFDNNRRVFRLITRIGDHFLAVTSLLIRLLLERDTFDDRLVFYSPIELGKNHRVVRIPETHLVTFLIGLPYLHFQESTIRNVIADQHATLLFVNDPDLTRAT